MISPVLLEALKNPGTSPYVSSAAEMGAPMLQGAQGANLRASAAQTQAETMAGIPQQHAALLAAQAQQAAEEARKQKILNDLIIGAGGSGNGAGSGIIQSLHAPAAVQPLPPGIAGPPNPEAGVEDYAQTIRNASSALQNVAGVPIIGDRVKAVLSDAQAKLWSKIRPKLDEALTPPDGGFDPLSGEKAAALSKASGLLPPELNDYDAAKAYMTNARGEQQNTVFNPNLLQSRIVGPLINESKNDAQRYNQTKGFLEQAEHTYQDYKDDPNDPGVRANMIAILDKFTGVSIQKSPTEAQLRLARAFPGLENLDKVTQWLLQGTPVAPEVLRKMMTTMRKEASGLASQLKDQNNARIGQFAQAGLPPYLNTPNETIDRDVERWQQKIDEDKKEEKNSKVATPQTEQEFNALPSGSLWKDSKGIIHKKK